MCKGLSTQPNLRTNVWKIRKINWASSSQATSFKLGEYNLLPSILTLRFRNYCEKCNLGRGYLLLVCHTNTTRQDGVENRDKAYCFESLDCHLTLFCLIYTLACFFFSHHNWLSHAIYFFITTSGRSRGGPLILSKTRITWVREFYRGHFCLGNPHLHY